MSPLVSLPVSSCCLRPAAASDEVQSAHSVLLAEGLFLTTPGCLLPVQATVVDMDGVEPGGAACRLSSACWPRVLTPFFVLQTPISTLSL